MFNCEIIDEFTPSKEIQNRRYVYDYMYHRLYGPASIQWYPTGALHVEEWLVNDFRHREDGPAYIRWRDNGTLYQEKWYIDGKLHHLYGPAYLHWYEYGILYKEGYWLYGIEINDAIKEWAIATGIDDIMAMSDHETILFKIVWEK